VETIGSKRSYALTWCMPNNDDDDDVITDAAICLELSMLLDVKTRSDTVWHMLGISGWLRLVMRQTKRLYRTGFRSAIARGRHS